MAGAAGRAVRWRRADDVLVRRTSRSVVVLADNAAEPVLLSGAAVVLWDALVEPRDLESLVASVGAHFAGAGPDDLATTCEDLQLLGVVVATP